MILLPSVVASVDGANDAHNGFWKGIIITTLLWVNENFICMTWLYVNFSLEMGGGQLKWWKWC